jgi:FkbM family methyltransferase
VQFASNFIARLPGPFLDAIVRARRNNSVFRRWSDGVADRLRGRDVNLYKGLAKGLSFNSGRSNAAYTFAHGAVEPDIERAMLTVLQPGMAFYDIGANFGMLSLIAARLLGPCGKVVAFEPLSENIRILEANVRLNNFSNVTLLPIALGDSDGRARFLLSSEPSWGTLASTGNVLGAYVGHTMVAVKRLDTAVRIYHLVPPQVIKIDVEGGETEVLIGAGDTIRRSRPLMLIEVHDSTDAIANMLMESDYAACLPGTSAPITCARGNVHILAIPRERIDCADLLGAFRDPTFPKCARCNEIGK